MARGRKAIPDELKKKKLTLTCKPENIDFLNTYCYTYGISISQLVDKLAVDLKTECEKREAKAARAARKASKENEQIPGQLSVNDIPNIMVCGDKTKMQQQIDALQELLKKPMPEKDRHIHEQGLNDLIAAMEKLM